jgi:Zn-dependent protease with chaperone function
MLDNIFWLIFAILPKGTVKDEGTFFILVSILLALIAAAYLMRWRRNRETP